MQENQYPRPDREEGVQEAQEVTLLGGTRFGKWFENFWYHYKLSFLAVLFLLVVVSVCVVQCATKPKEADLKLCYAGRASLMATSTNTAQADIITSLGAYLPEDADTVDVLHYLIDKSSQDPSVQGVSQSNLGHFRDELNLANAYIYLLDEALYLEYTPAGETHYMREVSPMLDGNLGSLELTSDGRGVYLRSTPLAALPGFSALPADTVLCLRVRYSAFEMGGEKKNATAYALYEELFVSCLTGTN